MYRRLLHQVCVVCFFCPTVLFHPTGISDEHNLCSGTLEEATDYARSILKQIFRPAMTRVRDSGMAEVMLKGINILNPLVDPEAFATFTRYGLRMFNYFQNKNSLVKNLNFN